jgi:hypothetical protein
MNKTGDLSTLVFDRKIIPKPLDARPHQKLVYCDPNQDEPDVIGFVSKPADDIPRNQLTNKFVRGIQSFVQRMQKREGYRICVKS